MIIGSYVINRQSKVKKALLRGKGKQLTEDEFATFNQLFGIYSSRIFGLCIYRTSSKMDKDLIEIKKLLKTGQ